MYQKQIRSYRTAAGTVCDLEIYYRNPVPIVVLSEREDNRGLSLTNAIESVAAEIQRRFFPERDGGRPPVHVIHRNLFGQVYLVEFENYRQPSFGRPTWHRSEDGAPSELLLAIRVGEISAPLAQWLRCI